MKIGKKLQKYFASKVLRYDKINDLRSKRRQLGGSYINFKKF